MSNNLKNKFNRVAADPSQLQQFANGLLAGDIPAMKAVESAEGKVLDEVLGELMSKPGFDGEIPVRVVPGPTTHVYIKVADIPGKGMYRLADRTDILFVNSISGYALMYLMTSSGQIKSFSGSVSSTDELDLTDDFKLSEESLKSMQVSFNATTGIPTVSTNSISNGLYYVKNSNTGTVPRTAGVMSVYREYESMYERYKQSIVLVTTKGEIWYFEESSLEGFTNSVVLSRKPVFDAEVNLTFSSGTWSITDAEYNKLASNVCLKVMVNNAFRGVGQCSTSSTWDHIKLLVSTPNTFSGSDDYSQTYVEFQIANAAGHAVTKVLHKGGTQLYMHELKTVSNEVKLVFISDSSTAVSGSGSAVPASIEGLLTDRHLVSYCYAISSGTYKIVIGVTSSAPNALAVVYSGSQLQTVVIWTYSDTITDTVTAL